MNSINDCGIAVYRDRRVILEDSSMIGINLIEIVDLE